MSCMWRKDDASRAFGVRHATLGAHTKTVVPQRVSAVAVDDHNTMGAWPLYLVSYTYLQIITRT